MWIPPAWPTLLVRSGKRRRATKNLRRMSCGMDNAGIPIKHRGPGVTGEGKYPMVLLAKAGLMPCSFSGLHPFPNVNYLTAPEHLEGRRSRSAKRFGDKRGRLIVRYCTASDPLYPTFMSELMLML